MALKDRELGIDAPCTLDWRKMTPAQGGRFCGDCKKVVRDLSSMTEAEARALVARERHAGLCVRMLVDRDGNVFFGGQALLPSSSLFGRAKRAAAAAAAIALPLAAQGCTAITEPLGITSSEQETEQHDGYRELMGGALPDDVPRIAPDDAGSDGGADASRADAEEATDAGPDAEADGGIEPIN